MEGRATLTIDTSSTTMNCATQAMARMSQSGVRRPFGVLVRAVFVGDCVGHGLQCAVGV